jgi:uncharacterized membrane protein
MHQKDWLLQAGQLDLEVPPGLERLARRPVRRDPPGFSLRPLRAYCPLRPWRADLASGPCWTLCAYGPLLAFNALRTRRSCGTCRSGWSNPLLGGRGRRATLAVRECRTITLVKFVWVRMDAQAGRTAVVYPTLACRRSSM